MTHILRDFTVRFGKPPPSRPTLFAWEKKAFETVSVRDAPRRDVCCCGGIKCNSIAKHHSCYAVADKHKNAAMYQLLHRTWREAHRRC
ncbi:hypothetical protein ANN_10637 [Periplaneta americana]|uniref:Uncharacterized protein n=1 Tax=Periplaneta americana TaxID=6978 RepID=A0ABQ8T473_PERAM|nr:hypothetical protein ANN_10637 [Periplaneta americana]